MVLDPLDVNAQAELAWDGGLVFCTLCGELVAKEDAKGFPEDAPREWVCHKCIIGRTDRKKEAEP